jgi:hypothetical protein
MKIHVNRGGQSLGQFSPEELRTGLREEKFRPDDLVWHDGMPRWEPLRDVVDRVAPEAAAAGEGGQPVVVSPEEGSLPWERRAEVGFLAGLLETIRLLMLEPKRAFGAMSRTGGLGAPLFFYVLVGTVGGLVGLFYQSVLQSVEGESEAGGAAWAEALSSPVAIGGTIMLLPVFLVCMAFVTAGVLHLALILVQGANRPFEATFRVTCFAGGATAILQLLPFFGALLATVWNLVLLVLGLAQVQNIGRGRAVVAVLLPAIVCCAIFAAAGFALFMALGGAEMLAQEVLAE